MLVFHSRYAQKATTYSARHHGAPRKPRTMIFIQNLGHTESVSETKICGTEMRKNCCCNDVRRNSLQRDPFAETGEKESRSDFMGSFELDRSQQCCPGEERENHRAGNPLPKYVFGGIFTTHEKRARWHQPCGHIYTIWESSGRCAGYRIQYASRGS